MKRIGCMLLILTVLEGAMFADSLNQADKWVAYTDKADGGASTISMTTADETIESKQYMVITAKGAVTTKFQYGYIGMVTTPDEATLAALKTASGITFKVMGDGNTYRVRLETTDVKDYNFNGLTFKTTKGAISVIALPYAKASQENWGTSKKFNAKNLVKISVHTVGQPIPAYEIKMFDFQIIK